MNRLLFFLFTLLFCTASIAQQNNFEVSLDHIALSVKNVESACEFYKEVLGLTEISNRTEMDGIKWLSLGQGRELHLISLLDDPVMVNKAVHFAVTVSNFQAFLDRLQHRNIKFSDWPGKAQKVNLRADGVKQVFFQDLDCYWIEVNSKEQR